MNANPYRIVIRQRESGEITETVAEYDGQPFTRESARAFAALRRAMLPNVFGRGVDATLTITIEEIEPEKPATIAERWLRDEHVYIHSGEELAACLLALADKVKSAGALARTHLSVNIQVGLSGSATDAERFASVDEIGAALGRQQIDARGSSYALKAAGSYNISAYAPHREEPAPDPTPAQLAAAALTPDAEVSA